MDKHKAIPQDYMGIGEVAKKMNVTVRTLQYYDREGLLSPSAISEGGRRLYTDKDTVKLHQILSLKHLGFSLDLEVLREEVLQMQFVDFKKYADIIVNLQMKNDFYWLIKYFDDQTLNHIRNHFDKDSGKAFINTFMLLQDEAIRLQNAGVPADSDKGQNFAKAYWNMLMDFTGKDISMLSRLIELGQFQNANHKWKEKQDIANGYVEQALGFYFSHLGIDPFQEKTGRKQNEYSNKNQ